MRLNLNNLGFSYKRRRIC